MEVPEGVPSPPPHQPQSDGSRGPRTRGLGNQFGSLPTPEGVGYPLASREAGLACARGSTFPALSQKQG